MSEALPDSPPHPKTLVFLLKLITQLFLLQILRLTQCIPSTALVPKLKSSSFLFLAHFSASTPNKGFSFAKSPISTLFLNQPSPGKFRPKSLQKPNETHMPHAEPVFKWLPDYPNRLQPKANAHQLADQIPTPETAVTGPWNMALGSLPKTPRPLSCD